MSNTKVTEQEFHSIKKCFRSGATSKEVQAEFKRGETIIRRIKKARSWPAYQAGNKARIERRKEQGLLDTNLSKKQSQGGSSRLMGN
ncbi:hypothetical protein J2X12_004149 [Pseudarthrobacter oxydans]|uniref:Uncharacterized protein n=1 Tax=Pseudarthrobacter oxydans TaxID=1671 RepID=A0AAW8NGU0_PSEOX|nr:hypothetical protein [Pseudarthrobacter oxydans]MDR6794703.1 hypothetical protein [Pseudarthrobacter oxydans]MDR7166095.1 hypothetical protein [Pseudarthrobacter oxydans]